MAPASGQGTRVQVQTSVDGFRSVWAYVLDRFFADFPYASEVLIHDFGATPGAVSLRLQQMADEVRS